MRLPKHPSVEDIVICEIDQGVIDVSKKYLPSLACGYDDKRVTVTCHGWSEIHGRAPRCLW